MTSTQDTTNLAGTLDQFLRALFYGDDDDCTSALIDALENWSAATAAEYDLNPTPIATDDAGDMLGPALVRLVATAATIRPEARPHLTTAVALGEALADWVEEQRFDTVV